MAAKNDPNLGLKYGWTLGEDNWNTGMDDNLLKLGALVFLTVDSVATAPSKTAEGTRYIVAASPTGDFGGHAGQVAAMLDGKWVFFTPAAGWKAFNAATGTDWRYDGAAWAEVVVASGGSGGGETAPPASESALPFALMSNPGATPFPASSYMAIPFYTNGEQSGITVSSSNTFNIPSDGLYMFDLEIRINGGATSQPPVGTSIAVTLDGTTTPKALRAGYSVAEAVKALSVFRLVCVERLVKGDARRAWVLNQGTAAYQVTSAIMKAVRLGA